MKHPLNSRYVKCGALDCRHRRKCAFVVHNGIATFTPKLSTEIETLRGETGTPNIGVICESYQKKRVS